VRDLDDELENLFALVQADADGLKPGVKVLNLQPIRDMVDKTRRETPRQSLESPLTGAELMEVLGIGPGPEIGKWKAWLTEKVLEGELAPNDKDGARSLLRSKRAHG
jgi:poly(A) polymerase